MSLLLLSSRGIVVWYRVALLPHFSVYVYEDPAVGLYIFLERSLTLVLVEAPLYITLCSSIPV